MTRSTVALVALSLVGCFATSTPVNGPDGKPGWYSIECRRSHANCIAEAGNVCPGGYDVADSSGAVGQYIHVDKDSATSVPVYNGTMLIRCRREAPKAATTEAPPETGDPKPAALVEEAIPPGDEWFCFRESEHSISSCARTEGVCDATRAGFAKNGPSDVVTECERREHAACFTYGDRLSGDFRAACSAALSDCERQRKFAAKNTVDYAKVSGCAPR